MAEYSVNFIHRQATIGFVRLMGAMAEDPMAISYVVLFVNFQGLPTNAK